jgi:signal peptidase I
LPARQVVTETKKRRSRSTSRSLIELAVTVAAALGLALLIQAYVVKPYKIPSGSMEPTLEEGQRVLVDRIGMHFGSPHVGEIVVFHPPKEAEQEVCGRPHPAGEVCPVAQKQEASTNFIKRVVAGPGDTIYVKEGHVYRDGTRETDPYIKACVESSECNFATPIKVPPGHWFMMGDNRGDSDDSRYWGPVPTSWIIGEAFATYWPPGRIGTL